MRTYIVRFLALLVFVSMTIGPGISNIRYKINANDINDAQSRNYMYTLVYSGAKNTFSPEGDLAKDIHTIYLSGSAEKSPDIEAAKKRFQSPETSYPGLDAFYYATCLAKGFSDWGLNPVFESDLAKMKYGLKPLLSKVPEKIEESSYLQLCYNWFLGLGVGSILGLLAYLIVIFVIAPNEVIKEIKRRFKRNTSLSEHQVESLQKILDQLTEERDKLHDERLPTYKIDRVIKSCKQAISELKAVDAEEAIIQAEAILANTHMLKSSEEEPETNPPDGYITFKRKVDKLNES